jgi:ribose-phosphate pyrophosphokinase
VETTLLLKENGAKRVFAACIHPVLVQSAVLRIFAAGVEGIIATDTLDKSVSVVTVAQLIANIFEGETIKQ